jgi:hypothetical protein
VTFLLIIGCGKKIVEFIAIQAIENEDLAQIIMVAQAQRRVYPKLDPFEIINDRMLIKIFRLSKDLLS